MMPKRPPSRTYRMLLALWHNSASESLVAPPSAISAVVQHASGITRERAVMSANGTKWTCQLLHRMSWQADVTRASRDVCL